MRVAVLSYMSSPAISGEDVTLGKTGYNPYRTSHFSGLRPWIDAGLSETAAKNYLGAIKSSLENKNRTRVGTSARRPTLVRPRAAVPRGRA